MAYDEQLAEQVRKAVGQVKGLTEKKMFGGLAFLIHGNMSVGIHGDELIVRIAPEDTDSALKQPGVRLFDVTGRPLVGKAGLRTPKALGAWVGNGVAYASSLPRK